MKKIYITPEIDIVRVSMESIMDNLDYSAPHIPVEDGGEGEEN